MNNCQIDNTDYYRLPCGKQLEDFIAWKNLDFFLGSALKYRYRAGHKDGESAEKDYSKIRHYCEYMSVSGYYMWAEMDDLEEAKAAIERLYNEANDWDGNTEGWLSRAVRRLFGKVFG